MRKVLIVGSKGFIGQHLRSYLERKGLIVWGADVVVDYTDPKYFLIDASNSDFREAFESEEYDTCINCSGAASVSDSLHHPLRDYSLNTVNVFKILETIRTLQPQCRFLNLSSAAVYGNPDRLPVTEGTPVSPVSPYGYHKYMTEQICEEFTRFFGIPTCSLRIFSAYGEGLKKQLFWDLYKKGKSESKITLFGAGDESRDFIYIDDLSQAIYLVGVNGNFDGRALNVANGEEITIKECARHFFAMFDHAVDFRFSGESRAGDPKNWKADITGLKNLGYERRFTFEEGLMRCFKWMKAIEEESE